MGWVGVGECQRLQVCGVIKVVDGEIKNTLVLSTMLQYNYSETALKTYSGQLVKLNRI